MSVRVRHSWPECAKAVTRFDRDTHTACVGGLEATNFDLCGSRPWVEYSMPLEDAIALKLLGFPVELLND